MTSGRELAAAVRPLEGAARAVLRFAELAHVAIRLEEGQAQATAALATTRTALEEARVELAVLQSEARGLGATLAAERAAAETETVDRCAGVVADAEALVTQAQAKAEAWAERDRAAAAAHATRIAAYQTEADALQAHVDDLRMLAQRLATAAAAVR